MRLILHPVDRFNPNAIVRKGRNLGNHWPDVEFVVLLLVH